MDSRQGMGARRPQGLKAAIEQAGGKAGCCCSTTDAEEQADRTPLADGRETGCCGGNARPDATRELQGRGP
ncbi:MULTISPECIES: hypothetical protein [unclassified Roseitalea]|uniref:hypothetical protein n=1 Tax=unclassified Roseitalea TaxID=2639107 RepID=UPI00273E824A|nr:MULTISPECIES: hypothetical protein [unclassified Roseitalea]